MQRRNLAITVVSLFLLVLVQGTYAAHDHLGHTDASGSTCQICHVGHFGKAALPGISVSLAIHPGHTIPAPQNGWQPRTAPVITRPARGPPV